MSTTYERILQQQTASKRTSIIEDLIARLEESQRKSNPFNDYKYWRKVFAASAIRSGESCENAVKIADELLARLDIKQEN